MEQGTDNNVVFKKVDATLKISCNVECPHCEDYIDLMKLDSLTYDGYIFTELLSDDGFGKANWGEMIVCPNCKKGMIICDVDY